MVINSIADIFTLLSSHGLFYAYAILFILKCFEGPIVSYFAAFAASLGYFNIWIIFILAVLSGIIPDVFLFLIGRYLRADRVERFVAYFGLSEKRMKWMEENIKKHSIKTIIVVKHVPPLPVPGILLFGFMRMDFFKFFVVSSILNLVGSTVFVTLGYYSGFLANNALRYIKMGELLIPLFVILIVVVYFLSKFLYEHLARLLKSRTGVK